jgi:hypothetical protein
MPFKFPNVPELSQKHDQFDQNFKVSIKCWHVHVKEMISILGRWFEKLIFPAYDMYVFFCYIGLRRSLSAKLLSIIPKYRLSSRAFIHHGWYSSHLDEYRLNGSKTRCCTQKFCFPSKWLKFIWTDTNIGQNLPKLVEFRPNWKKLHCAHSYQMNINYCSWTSSLVDEYHPTEQKIFSDDASTVIFPQNWKIRLKTVEFEFRSIWQNFDPRVVLLATYGIWGKYWFRDEKNEKNLLLIFTF